MFGWRKWLVWGFVLVVAWLILESAERVLLLMVALGGGYLAWTSGIELIAKRGRPRVTATPTELRTGESLVLRYAPPPTPPEGFRGTRVRLLCRESSERRAQNGRRVTDSHDWVVEEVDGESEGELELAIPADAMHSFATRHHAIAWLVEAQARGRSGEVGPIARTDLTVLPARYEP